MSLKIIKAGILDSVQDSGRYGYRNYGINPTGVMDTFAANKANLLVGNDLNDAVIELHFPASQFLFEHSGIIALAGADFGTTLNDQIIPNDSPIAVPENSILRLTRHNNGARCYLAVAGGFDLPQWLKSYSTHFKAAIGGWMGRKLLKDDVLPFRRNQRNSLIPKEPLHPSHYELNSGIAEIMVLPGNEWKWISEDYKSIFLNSEFLISMQSDRMGYMLNGNAIYSMKKEELVSSPVCFGTIQLLPDGQLIILMADHQTTGGYPRIANIISAHRSVIVQKKPGDLIRFKLTDMLTAENLYFERMKQLDDWTRA